MIFYETEATTFASISFCFFFYDCSERALKNSYQHFSPPSIPLGAAKKEFITSRKWAAPQQWIVTNVVDPNILDLESDPEFWVNSDPDPRLFFINFETKQK